MGCTEKVCFYWIKKRYLQVHNKASNIACRAELGKFPMIIDINKKILNYLDYLRGKDEDSIVKVARLDFWGLIPPNFEY